MPFCTAFSTLALNAVALDWSVMPNAANNATDESAASCAASALAAAVDALSAALVAADFASSAADLLFLFQHRLLQTLGLGLE